MKSNLDVWAIQKDKDETRIALKNVKKDSCGNILYLNCWCDFYIADKVIKGRLFDSFFYSEDSDTLILFSKGQISEEEIENYLKEFGIEYTVVRFKTPTTKEYVGNDWFPDIWFAREEYVLREAIDDSLSKCIEDCTYFPNKEAGVSLSYRDEFDVNHEIEGRFCKGVLNFDDKIVLLISQDDKRNLKRETVEKILKEKDIACIVKEEKFQRK